MFVNDFATAGFGRLGNLANKAIKTHVYSKTCFLQLCKTQGREYMTDGYDIITEISTTYNSEHSEVAQAFRPCKHQDTTSPPL